MGDEHGPEQKDVFAGGVTGANGGPATYTMTLHSGTPTTITPNTIQRLRMLQRQQARKMPRKNKRPKHSTDGVKGLQTKIPPLKPGSKKMCKFGDKPATKLILWGEGMGKYPVCDDHVEAGKDKVGRSFVDGVRDIDPSIDTKDASQSKKTGGMVALIPDDASAKNMAVDHSNAESPDELHMTLAYLGPDVTHMPAEQQQALLDSAREYAQNTSPIRARAFAHATFNPDGGPDDDMDPCATYIIGNEATGDGINSGINHGVDKFAPYAADTAHQPFIPHVTAGYNMQAHHLDFSGAVRFDKVRVALAGKNHDFEFQGVETKRDQLLKYLDSSENARSLKAGQGVDPVIGSMTQKRIDLLILTADVRDSEVKTVFEDLGVELKGVLKREPGVHNWIDRLPKALGDAFDASIVYRAAVHMNAEHGMAVGHAIASALNWAKYICDTGDVKQWSGIQNVKAPSRAEACAAIKLWQTMRAYAKAHKAGKAVGKATSKSG